ncbi:MAG: T9SS type A sorting domain-containing protein [Flavobacteriales bacterium]|nr:T9SS type A sorting domain-containing protein [Flavobacteriales bacterium]
MRCNTPGCAWTENFFILSVDETAHISLELFPNPASDVFTLKSSTRIQSVEVYNAVSELVFSIPNPIAVGPVKNAIQLCAATWAEGVYEVAAHNDDEHKQYRRMVVVR